MARPLGGRRRAEATVLPAWIKPQLTKLLDQPPNGSEWLHKLKFDGYRMHALLDRGAVRLLTRTEVQPIAATRPHWRAVARPCRHGAVIRPAHARS
jgi:ATP-dependent DNA ligase